MTQNPFSLIADFDGNIEDLFKVKPEGSLPILPLRNMVVFPGVVVPVTIGRESSLTLIKQAVSRGEDAYFAISCQIDSAVEIPNLSDLYPTGTLAKVLKLIELPHQHTTAILQTFGRVAIDENPTRVNPYLRAKVSPLEESIPAEEDTEFQALCETLREKTLKYIRANDNIGAEAVLALQTINNPVFFINFIATNLPFDTEEKALLLEEGDIKLRAYRLLQIVQRELQYVKLKQKIQEKTKEELDQQQKEYFLQQQIKNIQSELGGSEGGEAKELRQKAEQMMLPDNVKKLFDKELQKLERINPHSPDYGVTLTYLETVLSLPWGKSTTDNMDLKRAQRLLDRDHFGMDKVKERILEHLAMMKVSHTNKPSIICLYGPPGVGKTSLCRSIAESLGRKYVRISLGGLHDESEIRGHRRTYIAAMCGRIMKSVIKAESNNPLFVLDEIDKVSGNNFNGDPQSALLELLDPEQNNAFHDNYLDFDYDLSQVFFIATANQLTTIPAPLRDRMELINVEGYLTEEKKEIAKRHLIPNELKNLDLSFDLKLSPAATEFLIERYTRESGVRQLEKQVSKLVRKVVHRSLLDEKNIPTSTLKPADIKNIMGNPPFSRDIYQGNQYAGVVTGLAWTAVGGEIMFIESSLSRSKSSGVSITGNLGKVMKESAQIALEYVKSHANILNIDATVFDVWSVHIHAPEGATPKDGPSAGITIATALASLFTQRKVRANIAMTGEITLRGRVLPVGGIKEKILAAKRAGITDIVLSEDNKNDILEIPQKYVQGVNFHYARTVEDVWAVALLDELVENPLTITSSSDKDIVEEKQA